MSPRIGVSFNEHDYDQLVLLAKLNKLTVQMLLRRIVRAYLDNAEPNHEKR